MVDNIIVATFSSVNAAHDAARAIKDLKEAGGTKFNLKSGIIVSKDEQGSVSVLKSLSGEIILDCIVFSA